MFPCPRCGLQNVAGQQLHWNCSTGSIAEGGHKMFYTNPEGFFFGIDGQYHPQGSFLGLDGQYHPRDTEHRTDFFIDISGVARPARNSNFSSTYWQDHSYQTDNETEDEYEDEYEDDDDDDYEDEDDDEIDDSDD